MHQRRLDPGYVEWLAMAAVGLISVRKVNNIYTPANFSHSTIPGNMLKSDATSIDKNRMVFSPAPCAFKITSSLEFSLSYQIALPAEAKIPGR